MLTETPSMGEQLPQESPMHPYGKAGLLGSATTALPADVPSNSKAKVTDTPRRLSPLVFRRTSRSVPATAERGGPSRRRGRRSQARHGSEGQVGAGFARPCRPFLTGQDAAEGTR